MTSPWCQVLRCRSHRGQCGSTTDDGRWLKLVSDLHQRLRDDVGGLRLHSLPEPGTKGVAGIAVIILASASALKVFVEGCRAWLGREDKNRRVEVTWVDNDGVQQKATIDGRGMDAQSFQQLARDIGRRVEG